MYFFKGLGFHKTLEVGAELDSTSDYDVHLRFNTRGDHAGLKLFVQLGRLTFEFSIADDRHWNYKEDRFFQPGDEHHQFEGYPHE